MIDYELRRTRLKEHLESMDDPYEAGFAEDDETPQRYLAVELDDDDYIMWAYSSNSVADLAESVESSDTNRSRFECFDLDTDKEFSMSIHVTSVTIDGETTNLWLRIRQ